MLAILSGCGRPEANTVGALKSAETESTKPSESLAGSPQANDLAASQPPENLVESQPPQDLAESWRLEELAGSWRLDGQKTTEKLKIHDSLQSIWGTGLSYGSGMEIGADGSFSFYIAINYGGTGTLTEKGSGLLAKEIVPHTPDENTSTPDSLLILPVIEDGTLYLTMECHEETMYWIPYSDADRSAMEIPDSY